jgi:hypothetical protein
MYLLVLGWERGMGEGKRAHIAAADADIGDTDYHVVGI